MSRIIFHEEAREAIRRGVRQLTRTVRSTLGPCGHTVKGNDGYNAAEDRIEDLVVAGVIDPKKVVRCVLQNAANVSTLLLTSDVLITKAI